MSRFKLDENIPTRVLDPLRQGGHDVMTVLEQGLGGAADAAVAEACAAEDRILVTLDLDFADIRLYGTPQTISIVVIRVARQDAESVHDALQRASPDLERMPARGSIWILEPHRIRAWNVGD